MLFQANAERSQTPRAEPRIVGRYGMSKVPAGPLQPREMLRICSRRPDHHVRMAADIFAEGEDADVDACGQSRKQQWRRPRVVQQGDNCALPGDGTDSW